MAMEPDSAQSSAELREALRRTCQRQGIDLGMAVGATIRAPASSVIELGDRGLAALEGLTDDAGGDHAPEGEGSAPPGLNDPTDDLELGDCLGRGGMGWVRLAQQRSLDREVAVKSLLPGRRTTAAMESLLREAQIAGKLEHPNTVPVHTLGWSPQEGPILVMKRVEGVSWKALIHDAEHEALRGEDPLRRHLEIVMEVCHAVHFAHSRGVVHRDIKPENVMVGDYGEVYLLDWGVALPLTERGDEPEHRIVGTPAYMAPEMVREGGEISERTDVYLLGACLREVLTGAPPHGGEHVVEVLAQACQPSPGAYPEGVAAELIEICEKACAVDAQARHPDAMTFRRDIAEFLRHRGSAAISELAGRSLALLEKLVGQPSDEAHNLRVHEHFSTCRFGYEQSLRDWEGNAAARRGLQRCLELMIAHEIATMNVGSAERLLADLPEPRPQLEAQLAQARSAVTEREQAQRTLAAMRQDMRIYGRDWGRSHLTLFNGLVSAGVVAYVGHGIRSGDIVVTPENNLAFMLVASAIAAAGVPLFRNWLLDSRLYRQIMFVYVAMGPLFVLNRLLAMVHDMPFHQVLSADLTVTAALCGAMAIILDRSFWISLALVMTAGAAALLRPDYALDFIAGAYLLHCLMLAWLLRPRRPTPR